MTRFFTVPEGDSIPGPKGNFRRMLQKVRFLKHWEEHGDLYYEYPHQNDPVVEDITDALIEEFGMPRTGLAECLYETLPIDDYDVPSRWIYTRSR